MEPEGMFKEVLDPFFEVAMKAVGVESSRKDKEKYKNKIKRCKWWNRGYCREKGECSFTHTKGDCEEHLRGGCNTKGCNILRHRKQCKYFNTDTGCTRGETCEYLHRKNKGDKETKKIHSHE